MAYRYYCPNPHPHYKDSITGDCVVRAISKVLEQTWNDTYWDLCDEGFLMGDWGNSNVVWDMYLRDCGFIRKVIPDTCPICYTIRDFCRDHPIGRFVLATGKHVIAVVDGDYYDTWDSGDEVPLYYYKK